MTLYTVNYGNLTIIPIMINGNTYMSLKTEVEELGHIKVHIMKMGKDKSKDAIITRQAYMDEHGMAVLTIDKTKVIMALHSGNMQVKNKE